MTREPLPGDYFVVHLPGPIPSAISACTSSWANHTGIVIPGGLVVEAWVPFVRIRPLSDYAGMQIEFSDDRMTDLQRRDVVAYARAAVGRPYDFLHFAALTLRHLLGIDLLHRTPSTASLLCSRLVTLAGLSAGIDWSSGETLYGVTPAVLARRLESFSSSSSNSLAA